MGVEYKTVFGADEFSAGVSGDATGPRNAFTGGGSDSGPRRTVVM